MKALFDTHILIDYLRGREEAKREIANYETPMVSAISVAELMAAAKEGEAPIIEAFLSQFEVVACDVQVAQLAASLKQMHKLDMESSLIWACAKAQSALFVTRNSQSYPPHEAGLRQPY